MGQHVDSSEYYDEDVDPDYEDDFEQDYDEEFWDDEDRSTTRERWLKIALLAVAAGLAATIISLLTQGSDDDADVSTETGQSENATADDGTTDDETAEGSPDTATAGANPSTSAAGTPSTSAADQATPPAPGSAAAAQSGTATIDIGVLTETGGQAAEVATQFNAADYDTTVTFLGDPDNYSGSPSVQGLRFAGGSYYYRPSAAEDWQAASDSSAVSLNEGIALPATIIGWSTAGLDELLAAAGIAPAADGQPATGTLTVAQARALAVLPPPVAVVAGDQWEWQDEQPITITATFTSGILTKLDALASDDDPDRIAGALTVSTVTAYSDLNVGTPIAAP